MDFFKTIRLFLRERKKYWLSPIIIVVLLLGLLIIFSGSSAVSPLFYYSRLLFQQGFPVKITHSSPY